jgi:hypothetical protein
MHSLIPQNSRELVDNDEFSPILSQAPRQKSQPYHKADPEQYPLMKRGRAGSSISINADQFLNSV